MTTIFIDTETTGLSHQHDEVLEISIINEHGDILLDTLVQPVRKTVWPEAEAIHGITPAMVKEQSNGSTLKDHAPTIARLINEASTVVIYNEGYDRPFIESAIAESGSSINSDTNWHCAMEEYAEKIGDWNDYRNGYRWHKLTDAARNVGHEWQGSAHRALADCLATLSVWKWLHPQDALTLSALRAKNKQRQAEWTGNEVADLSFRTIELAGETGELCEAIKKHLRATKGIHGTQSSIEDIIDEVGDVLISLDLLCMELGIDLEQAVTRKFNKTSDKYGLRTKFITQ